MLNAIQDLSLLPASIVESDGAQFGLRRAGDDLHFVALGSADQLHGFVGERSDHGGQTLLVGATDAANLAELRKRLPWLRPSVLGTRTSAGMGDRLGLATPGHVRALRAVTHGGGKLAPIFPQQSIREMARTGRSAQIVMDDATWGVFAEGWRDGFGADADHLKTFADIENCAAAGFTFFTIDPGEYVEPLAETGSPTELRTAFEALPWDTLEDSSRAMLSRYTLTTIENYVIPFDEATTIHAAVKYGRVVAHVLNMARHLKTVMGDRPYEIEVSVDETESPTTHAEHLYIVREMARLGITWVSLAPRFIGRFEKGVDYIGDLAAFEADFAVHAAIARESGGYKLSLHSGSDKFSIYPIAARQAHGLVHLKTAGTSYLEALRTIAALDPAFFRAIYVFARGRYETDRATYHVSAQLDRAPAPESLADADLPTLFEQFDARQILHVTFGSTLIAKNADGKPQFADHLLGLLRAHPEDYAVNLERHFVQHLAPFVQKSRA